MIKGFHTPLGEKLAMCALRAQNSICACNGPFACTDCVQAWLIIPSNLPACYASRLVSACVTHLRPGRLCIASIACYVCFVQFLSENQNMCGRLQIKCLGKWGVFSFCWSLFKWFFSGFGDSCGFDGFPTFGFHAKRWKCAALSSLTRHINIHTQRPAFFLCCLRLSALLT